MTEKVVPFVRCRTPEEALGLMRQLGELSDRVGLAPKVQGRLRRRRASRRQIDFAIQEGAPDGPYRDLVGDWMCRFGARVVGSNVEVEVLMVGERRLVVMTIAS